MEEVFPLSKTSKSLSSEVLELDSDFLTVGSFHLCLEYEKVGKLMYSSRWMSLSAIKKNQVSSN